MSSKGLVLRLWESFQENIFYHWPSYKFAFVTRRKTLLAVIGLFKSGSKIFWSFLKLNFSTCIPKRIRRQAYNSTPTSSKYHSTISNYSSHVSFLTHRMCNSTPPTSHNIVDVFPLHSTQTPFHFYYEFMQVNFKPLQLITICQLPYLHYIIYTLRKVIHIA